MSAPPDLPDRDETGPPAGAVVETLVANHRAFLAYLERRLGRRDLAEDVLQDAFVRAIDHAGAVPDEAAVPWFYRVLKNAVIDRYRRQGAEARALEAFARELEATAEPPPELNGEICACVARLATTLSPAYAEAISTVDLGGAPVTAFAAAQGLTPSNAGVRLFRARKALRARVAASCGTCADHGCLDCSCGRPSRPPA